MEQTEPTVIIALTPKGLEKAFVLYEEDNPAMLEAGNLLLARISLYLTLLDSCARMGNVGGADPTEEEAQNA